MNTAVLLAALSFGLDADWVLPPDVQGSFCRLVVDPRGEPWLGCQSRFLLGPAYAETKDLGPDAPFAELLWLPSGLVGVSGERLGVYEGRKFRELARFPGRALRLFSASGADAFYLTASAGAVTELYLFSGGRRQRLLVSSQHLSAAGGDGTRHFVAVSKRLLALEPEGPVELYEHPDEAILGIEYEPGSGVYYATRGGVGRVGPRLEQELLSAVFPEIRLSGGALLVRPGGRGGVLRLSGLSRLNALDAALAASAP